MSTGSIDYTSEEEIAAYLTNLSLEYRFGCYEEKSPKSCQLLGEFFESITRETEKAFQVFEANCIKNKFGPSCNKAGHQKILGISTNPDPVSSMTVYLKFPMMIEWMIAGLGLQIFTRWL